MRDNILSMTQEEWREWHAKHTSEPSMSDPANTSMWSRAKQVATYIVGDWMRLDEVERTMDKLVEEIELELDRSFDAGMRAASHAMPLIRARVLEEAAKAFEPDEDGHDSHSYLWKVEEIAVAIRALKEKNYSG